MVEAIAQGKLDSPAVSEKDRTLLRYVEKLTLRQNEVSDADIEALRKAGWKEEEIWDATATTALFAFFTRMADAYDLDYPMGGYLPPDAGAAPRK